MSQTESDRRYALEARSADRMHQVFVDILGGPRETRVTLMDHFTMPRR